MALVTPMSLSKHFIYVQEGQYLSKECLTCMGKEASNYNGPGVVNSQGLTLKLLGFCNTLYKVALLV